MWSVGRRLGSRNDLEKTGVAEDAGDSSPGFPKGRSRLRKAEQCNVKQDLRGMSGGWFTSTDSPAPGQTFPTDMALPARAGETNERDNTVVRGPSGFPSPTASRKPELILVSGPSPRAARRNYASDYNVNQIVPCHSIFLRAARLALHRDTLFPIDLVHSPIGLSFRTYRRHPFAPSAKVASLNSCRTCIDIFSRLIHPRSRHRWVHIAALL